MRAIYAALLQTAVLAVTSAAPVAAQPPASSFAELQGRLQPDQTVSVYSVPAAETGRPFTKTTGKVLEISDHRLRLLVHRRPQEFFDRDVRVIAEIYTKRKAALIGLSIGAMVGLLNMAKWCQPRRDADSCGNAMGALLIWTGLGAAVG